MTWPAVIFPGFRVVQLVAAPGAVLHGPELSGLGMERRLDVAMAVRPDLRQRAGAVDERLSRGAEPSGLMRTTLPSVADRSWALGVIEPLA